jgi:transposase
MTQDLEQLAEWLRQFRVTEAAMESSGVYWKPVWNILEGQFTIVLANAQHIKNVPGRKTDQKDAEWIAQCYNMVFCGLAMYPAKSSAICAT